jgi:hypothetical protein
MLYNTLRKDIHAARKQGHEDRKRKDTTVKVLYVGFFEALVELGVTAVFLAGACVACGLGGSLLGGFAPDVAPWVALATVVGYVAC